MASAAHPSFPSRAYPGNLGKLPDRSMAPTFGASTTQQQRENARLERERERLEKERLEREEQNQLTEEQREEIKEAVSFDCHFLINSYDGDDLNWGHVMARRRHGRKWDGK